jgi:hypothetical protein
VKPQVLPAQIGTYASTDTATDVAYALGYATPAFCCLVVVGVVVFFLIRRSRKR